MSAITLLAQRIHRLRGDDRAAAQSCKEKSSTWGEVFWFALSFVLFLALGPFSVIAVIPGVLSLVPHSEEAGEPLPDTE